MASYNDLLNQWRNSSYYTSNIASNPEKYYQWIYSLSDDDRNVMFNNGWLTNESARLAYDTWANYQNVANGSMNPEQFEAWVGLNNAGRFITPEQMQYMNNMLSNQRTNEARQWEEYAAKNNLIWSGDQLNQLGLSSSGVLQTGGSGVNAVGPAQVSMKNNAQERAIERYQQRMALAKQLISMTGSMASAGIYGKAIGTARRASGIMSSQAAHSGLNMMKHYSGYGNPTYLVDANGLLKL